MFMGLGYHVCPGYLTAADSRDWPCIFLGARELCPVENSFKLQIENHIHLYKYNIPYRKVCKIPLGYHHNISVYPHQNQKQPTSLQCQHKQYPHTVTHLCQSATMDPQCVHHCEAIGMSKYIAVLFHSKISLQQPLPSAQIYYTAKVI